ncbi:MAG: ASKHA domain-containing protein [bacterium]
MSLKKYSIAIDLGTTTVAAALIDQKDNKVILEKSSLNLQYPEFGLDSVKRIQNGLNIKSVKKLQEKALLTIANLLNYFIKERSIELTDIHEIALAGNTAMELSFCGYPLADLSKPPYKPAFNIVFPEKINELKLDSGGDGGIDANLMDVNLMDVNLISSGSISPNNFNPGKNIGTLNSDLFIFPILDGFVGGDTVSSIYYLDMHNKDNPVFIADFGTNVEIAIGNKNKIFTTSAPAGPAFEGGNIRHGMLAQGSAVSSIELKNGIFDFKTISGSKIPEGICGSGIIDLMASLLREKIIDKNGRILPTELIDSESYSVVSKGFNNEENEVIVYRDNKTDIRFYQDDVRQFQFAKSAVKSAAEILINKYKININDNFDVYISGSFGNYIKNENIDIIDIFPFKNKKINYIYDSSLEGCKKYLISEYCARKKDISKIMSISKNFPLSGSKLFETLFIKNLSWQ